MSRFFLPRSRRRRQQTLYTVDRLQDLHERLEALVVMVGSAGTVVDGQGQHRVGNEQKHGPSPDNKDEKKDDEGDSIEKSVSSPPSSPSRMRSRQRSSFRQSIKELLSGVGSEEGAKHSGRDPDAPIRRQDLKEYFRDVQTSASDDQELPITKDRLDDLERTVIDTIHSVGEVLIGSEEDDGDDDADETDNLGSQRGSKGGYPGSSGHSGASSGATAATAHLRSDPVFEYFCETAMLQLLVDLACEKPTLVKRENTHEKVNDNNNEEISDSDSRPQSSPPSSDTEYHGIVWSPSVKAQILKTVSLLVSNTRDATALYFILSQHCVNDLIACMLPLQQWTDPALRIMLPAYVDLLHNLALQLSASPHLLPCFTVVTSAVANDGGDGPTVFPLFSATLETAVYSYVQSDSFAHATCLTLLIDLMRIESVHSWCGKERHQYQAKLSNHLCQLLLDRYHRLATLATGPVVNAVRSTAVATQIAGLDDDMLLLNDVFWCNVDGLNVCLCESLLRNLVSVLLKALIPVNSSRTFMVVGVIDADIIPEPEARMQASMFFLSRLFARVEYAPFVRMLAVALFHPYSTSRWDRQRAVGDDAQQQNGNEEVILRSRDDAPYLLTLALNAIVRGAKQVSNGESNSDISPSGNFILNNPYRVELVKALSGIYGEYMFIPTAILVETLLDSDLLDLSILQTLKVLPELHEKEGQGITSFEHALSAFLKRHHVLQSAISPTALECAASLSVKLIYQVALVTAVAAVSSAESGSKKPKAVEWSPVKMALEEARSYLFRKTLQSEQVVGVSDIFVDLIETAVTDRYKRRTMAVHGESRGPSVFAFVLSQHGCHRHQASPEILTRRIHGVGNNDVEATRFYSQMAFHFRALCRVVGRFAADFQSYLTAVSCASPRSEPPTCPSLDTMDEAEELANIFGSVQDKPAAGTDLDLRGRMVFNFTSTPEGDRKKKKDENTASSRSQSDDKMIFQPSSQLALVLDPTDMFIVKPFHPRNSSSPNRGTVICCIPLLKVIAAAADGEWLHVAVRHEDVGFLIRNGNLVLRFQTPGTCLIVRQYLERCRQVLRGELREKIKSILRDEGSEEEDDDPKGGGTS